MGLLMLNGHAYAGFTEPAEIYSTEEREIGVWIDGKPLYQKTFVVQKTTVGVQRFLDLSSLNIESCVQTIGWFINGGGTHNYIPFYTSSSDFGVAYYQNGYLNGYNGGDHTKATWYVTLQYTKTTDSAGSGKWTTSGVPAHHYSTSEQIIGTWINGKPIYEIVLQADTKTNAHTTIDVSSLNIDIPLNADVFGRCTLNGTDFTLGSYFQDNNDGINTYLQSNKTTLVVRSKSSYPRGENMYVVLRYTKTTD